MARFQMVMFVGRSTYDWHESYKAALLEIDWSRILQRIQEAESAIFARQRVLSLDHGGTPEERHALTSALSGLKALRVDVAQWNSREQSENSL